MINTNIVIDNFEITEGRYQSWDECSFPSNGKEGLLWGYSKKISSYAPGRYTYGTYRL